MISKQTKDLLKKFDVVINVGDADTAQSGGENWIDETIITAVREFVYNGGGFIGVGEPAAHQWQGRFIQLDDVLGVEEEHGFNLNTDKYNWEEHRDHFILKDAEGEVDFGEGKKNIYALPETEILIQKDQEVQMAVKTFGKGRGVYISGLPYSFKNSRVLIVQSFGQHPQRKNFTAGIHQLQCRSTCLRKKWKILRSQQHLRTTGYSSLQR